MIGALKRVLCGENRRRVSRPLGFDASGVLVVPVVPRTADDEGGRSGRRLCRRYSGHQNPRVRRRWRDDHFPGCVAVSLQPLISDAQAHRPDAVAVVTAELDRSELTPLSRERQLAPVDNTSQHVDDAAHGVASVQRGEWASHDFNALDLICRQARPGGVSRIGRSAAYHRAASTYARSDASRSCGRRTGSM